MTDRAAHLERTVAQPEAIAFFNKIGIAKKNRDGVSGDQNVKCPYCQKWHTHHSVLIPHTDIGVPDYSGTIRTQCGYQPYSYVCEIKAGGIAFPMNRIADEQWDWMSNWEKKTNGTAWFWIMIGEDAINSVVKDESGKSVSNPFRRATYLIPLSIAQIANNRIGMATGWKQSILYSTRSVPRQKYGEEYAKQGLYADEFWAAYRMSWGGLSNGGGWTMPAHHPFNYIYNHAEQEQKAEENNG